jgi:S-adenosylmethionine hydrolase
VMKESRIIALLTDFGLGNPYVAAMKGQILSVYPRAIITDISHTVAPFNIKEAAYVLWSACRNFPKGTIFVIVVDPGVGGSRKILLAESAYYKFLAPDNGVLRFVQDTLPVIRTREVKNDAYFNKPVSPTFHGRDIFAPVAAHLARGLSPQLIGPIIKPISSGTTSIFRLSNKPGRYQGEIIHIDAFGNIITNAMLKKKPSSISVRVGQKTIKRYYDTYIQAPEAIPFLLMGSSQLLEVSVKNGSAAGMLRAKLNQKITIHVP